MTETERVKYRLVLVNSNAIKANFSHGLFLLRDKSALPEIAVYNPDKLTFPIAWVFAQLGFFHPSIALGDWIAYVNVLGKKTQEFSNVDLMRYATSLPIYDSYGRAIALKDEYYD